MTGAPSSPCRRLGRLRAARVGSCGGQLAPASIAKMLEALEDGGAPSTPTPEGPLVGVVAVQGNVYSAPTGNREARIGYIRRGGKVVANPQPVKGKNCDEGWFHLVPFGYVCGKVATLDLDNPQVRLGVREPALDEILP